MVLAGMMAAVGIVVVVGAEIVVVGAGIVVVVVEIVVVASSGAV